MAGFFHAQFMPISAVKPSDITYQRPWLYPKQEAALFNDARYALVEASTKSGKTVGCIVWLTEQALKGGKGKNYWWVAPSHNQAGIAFNRFCESFTHGTYTSNKTDRTVTLLNGAVLWFRSGEDPDKLYGEDVWAAVIDEASRVRETAWIAVRSTLTATGGKARIIGNVKGRKNWFYRMAKRAREGAPNMHYAKLTVHDAITARVFDEAEAEDARANMPEQAYRELYLAEPSDDSGNPFGGDEVISACEIPEVEWDTEPVCWGWDLAKSKDWTVGVALNKSGNVCRFYRWQRSWRDTIRLIVDYVGKTPTLVDATGVGDPVLELLQQAAPRTVEGFKFNSTSKQQLMEALAIAIQRQEIGFPEQFIGEELKSFEYLYTRTAVKYSAPEGEYDDCVCALALAWKHWRKPPKPDWVTRAMSWQPPAGFNIFAR